ncbi:hypothetical protein AAIH46_18005 [Rhizobium sp. 0TCS1.26]|uniref:hypothetical protein n=1 Tax=Rhizobium sp. 0TCS1.26 TaxID=3142623 RepID=UPI003D2BCD88
MNALVTIQTADPSDIVATVERARALLDDGDVQAALLLSGGAYEQAKAAGGYASKVKASRQLIDKFRRLQADALSVESYATIALSEIVDDAQAKGSISRGGRPETVQASDRFTLDDVGLDKRRLHEARKLAKAERDEPGIVQRAIEARVEAGLSATRGNLSHAIGTQSRSKEERGQNAYFSPIEGVRTILALESFSARVKEPACGKGAISQPFEAAGYDALIADLVDYSTTTKDGELQQVGDFLLSVAGDTVGDDIVTNPPYGKHILNRFVAHALREHKPRKMALLLNLNFMCGCTDPDRLYAMQENPPSRIYVFTRRLPMMHQDGWDGEEASSQMNTAWFVWERNEDGSYGQGHPQLIRVDWKNFEAAPALLPGAGGNVAPAGLSFRAADDEFARETPRKSLEQRVADWRDAVRTHLTARGGGVTAGELRREVGLRPSTVDEIIIQLVADGFLSPADDEGRHQVLAGKGDV